MEKSINNYIDFKTMFFELYEYELDDLLEKSIYNDSLGLILQFNDVHKNTFEIMSEECELTNTEIIFVFGYDFNDANESDPRSATADYVFIYDRISSEWKDAEYNQG